MKSLENVKLTHQGKPLVDAGTEQQLDTITCVRALLDNVEYASRADQRAADKVYAKLENLTSNEGVLIELEDADFELIKRHIVSYKPYLNGRMFGPILDQFDN